MAMTNRWQLPWHGECRCGQTRLRVMAAPLLAMACHCTGCQRMSASAFSLSLAIPVEGFEVIAGAPVVGGVQQGPSHHYFCPHCKSWLFTRTDGMENFVNLRPTLLERHGWFAPFIETWTSEKLPWAVTGAAHSFEGFPPVDAFPGLIAAFAANGTRPGPVL